MIAVGLEKQKGKHGLKHLAVSILFLLPAHCKVITTERFRIRTTEHSKRTKMEPKGNKWNPFRLDFDYPGWMNSEKRSGQVLDARRRSLVL